MKNLKKTLAVVSSVAVVAACAMAAAIPASADSVDVNFGAEDVQYEEGVNTITVPVEITGDQGATSVGMGVTVSDQVSDVGVDSTSAVFASDNDTDYWYANAFANEIGADSTVDTVNVTFELTDDQVAALESGEDVDVDLLSGTATNFATGDASGTWSADIGGDDMSFSGGSVTVKGLAVEEPEETTEAPVVTTEAPVEAPVVVETTEAPAVATVTPVAVTSSPKTGEALPIAGVVVAVAVIGGIALVSKKRK